MRNTEVSDRTRKTILNFFRSRDCLTMVRPTNGKNKSKFNKKMKVI